MIRSARGVEMIFGSPEKDPNGIAREEGWDLDPLCSTSHIGHACGLKSYRYVHLCSILCLI